MDNLREALTSAFEETPAEEPSTVAASEPVSEVAAVEPATIEGEVTEKVIEPREEKVVADKPTVKAEPIEKSPSEKAVGEKETPAPKLEKSDHAPASWKGDAKKVWDGLPQQVKQEVARRERDTLKVLQENAQQRGQIEPLVKVIQANQDIMHSQYKGDPVAALTNMMNVDRQLTTGTPQSKAEFVAHIIKHFNINILALDAALSGTAMPQPVAQQSQIDQIVNQKLAPFMTQLQRQQEAEKQAAAQKYQAAVQTVESMATDPAYPYFDDVRDEMADIIEMGAKKELYISLPDAYSKAVRLNDSTFSAVQAAGNTAQTTQTALAAHQQAQRAKGAAVSISGNPSGISDSSHVNSNDLRSVIASQFGDAGARL